MSFIITVGNVFAELFLSHEKEVAELLRRLSSVGKKLFLVTNSSVNFVYVFQLNELTNCVLLS